MIISGKNVVRVNAVEDALINATDLFATLSELAGNNTPTINDSISFLDLLTSSNVQSRDFIYAERSAVATPDYTIRNQTHKYIRFDNGNQRFFNLIDDPFENTNLLNANQLPLSNEDSTVLDELINEIDAIRN